jgi:exopolysaccharide biosynthesis protein
MSADTTGQRLLKWNAMRRLFWPLLFCVALLFATHQWRAQGRVAWQRIAPGVEMRRFDAFEHGLRMSVVAFRTTPSRLQVAVGAPREVSQWRRELKALVAVNGGFFDLSDRSLGLRVSNGERRSPMHGTRWSVFRIKAGKAAILPASDVAAALKRGVSYQQAVQCGPVLVKNRRVGDFKTQWAQRTALGIQDDGRVVIAVTQGQMTFETWAQLWAARDGLNCRDALSLDGGSSTQLSLRAGKTTAELASGRVVPDVVLIK